MESHEPLPRKAGRRPGPPESISRSRISASHIVENELRQTIISMRLKPGVALNEKELASHFGISRTPVREAMLRLKEDGLVEVFPQSGTFVARIPLKSIPEAVVIRQALESMAVEHAARRHDAATIAELRACVEIQQSAASADDQHAFHEGDEAFHAMISQAAGFPGIWSLAQTVKTQIDRCRRLTLPVPGRMARVIGEHRRIIEAVASGDVATARQAISAHIEAVLPDLSELQRENPDYFI